MSDSINSVQVYKRLLGFVRKYITVFLLGIVGTGFLSLIDAGFTWLIKPIINQGFIHRDKLFIYWLPLIILLIFLLRGIAGFSSNYFTNRVARSIVMDFRFMIFKKFLMLPAAFYDRYNSGNLLSTIIYDVEQVAQASSDALLTFLRESSLAISLVVVMLLINWKLALLFLIIAPLLNWVLRLSSKRLKKLSVNVQRSVGDVTRVAGECIRAYKVIRLFSGQKAAQEEFFSVALQNRHRELKVVITNSLGTAIVQILLSIPLALSLLLATMPYFQVSAGDFGAIIAAMISLLRPVRRMSLVHAEIQKGVAAASSIFNLLDESVEEDVGEKILVRSKGNIAYQNVSFTYPGHSRPVLENVSFSVGSGTKIAIVGKSGSGKTSLVNLLPRFYTPTEGRILVDGEEIQTYSLQSLRNQFSFVSQHTLLFDDTVYNNIAYGGNGHPVSYEEVYAAAEAAFALDFIHALPEGFHTRVGEGGGLLSGGQRQRIAIARALLKKAPILILDEATSALDNESERYIQYAMDKLAKNSTTLVIAHRLSTIENADWIIVMDNGRIVEQGTHQDLLQKQSYYAALHGQHFRCLDGE